LIEVSSVGLAAGLAAGLATGLATGLASSTFGGLSTFAAFRR